jgi:hypothetical protein
LIYNKQSIKNQNWCEWRLQLLHKLMRQKTPVFLLSWLRRQFYTKLPSLSCKIRFTRARQAHQIIPIYAAQHKHNQRPPFRQSFETILDCLH